MVLSSDLDPEEGFGREIKSGKTKPFKREWFLIFKIIP